MRVAAPISAAAAEDAKKGRHTVESDALLRGEAVVNIAHNGETYQLRTTRLGKLILTK